MLYEPPLFNINNTRLLQQVIQVPDGRFLPSKRNRVIATDLKQVFFKHNAGHGASCANESLVR